MKKATLLSILASGSLLFSTALPTISVMADSTATSNATAAFKENNTNPVNPVDPEDPDTPGENPGTGNNGPLSIDYASSFDFGTHDVPTKDETYTAADDKNGNANYVQVTDQRSGDPKGWTLSVAEESQLSTTGGDELTGAQLSLGTGTVKTTTGNDTNGNNTVSSKTGATPLATDGSSSTVMSATAGGGFGTWLDVFGEAGASSVKLNVPVSAHPEADSYSSKLTWTLSETPGND
ncbi:WxL domain-containing protein [Paucilactobacillus kaifaensis]|uniref:WxL domain-containing protein n=1 Tax=Paucilactobacillus kaifaensis TaxID=2559921 RepID=UPI0010F54D72|nr:WxL domain-containing protein [Paucilactobacillus kaifaensis]